MSDAEEAYTLGAATWPGLVASHTDFEAIGEACRVRMAKGGELPAWDAVNAADVFLVAAVMGGKPEAHAAFDRAILEPCRAPLARLGIPPAGVDDALAELRGKLLVADGAELPIARQTGEGNLVALVRVMAVRAGINRQKREKRYTSEDTDAVEALLGAHSPAGKLLTDEAKALLRRVIAAAVATLEERDQTLLRLHLYHRMSIDDLGRTYGVHRATAARWLAKIHDAIDTQTRKALAEELRTESDHLRSVMDAARTGLTSAFANALGIAQESM
jgi:RNA polymerase sigma-70 factor (ECF subfamily)